jgi:hypothetical protein
VFVVAIEQFLDAVGVHHSAHVCCRLTYNSLRGLEIIARRVTRGNLRHHVGPELSPDLHEKTWRSFSKS